MNAPAISFARPTYVDERQHDLEDFVPRHLTAVDVLKPSRLRTLRRIERIVVLGSSGVGKTTMINGARKYAARSASPIYVPKRYITRPPRENDDLSENIHVSAEEFQHLVEAGEIGIHWKRKLEEGRTEHYGFAVTPGGLDVLAGNNALYSNRWTVRPAGVLARETLWIAVYAPDELREARLRHRSPDLFRDRASEIAYRLSDSAENALEGAHLRLNTYDRFEPHALADFLQIIRFCMGSEETAHGVRRKENY